VFTAEDVRASFNETTFRRGLEYANRGLVVHIEVGKNGAIRARVQGSISIPYEVTISPGRSRRIDTFCDCPIEYNCKHGAAAAIVALELQRNGAHPSRAAYDPSDPSVSAWLEELEAYGHGAAVDLQAEHLRYVLDLVDDRGTLALTPRIVSLLKNGERSTGRILDFQHLGAIRAGYIAPIDRTIARLANASGITGPYAWTSSGTNISPRLLAVLLSEMLETQRLHWRSTKTPPLTRCDLADQRIVWNVDGNGRQRPVVDGHASLRLLPANPVWYVDPDRSEGGSIDLGIAPEAALLLVTAPPLSGRQAQRAQSVWKRLFGSGSVPAPPTDVETFVIEREPTPVLQLRGISSPVIACAELTFAYGTSRVRPSDQVHEFQENEQGRVTIWPRHYEFEANARNALRSRGFIAGIWPEIQSADRGSETLRFPAIDDRRWAEFLDTGITQLRERGWIVEIDPSFPYELIEADDWDARVEPSENRWFEFDLGITIAGARVSLLPIVVDALRELDIHSLDELAELGPSASIYGRLPSGAFMALPTARIAPILTTLIELFDVPLTADGRLSLTPLQIASIDQLERAMPVRWTATAELRELLRTLSDEDALPPPELPETFEGTLRHYQARGVTWLQLLARGGLGGILADDMGLGKTVQLLAHLAIEKHAGHMKNPVLIVSPTSVAPNWLAEIARFVPHLRVLALTGADRSAQFAQIENSDVVLTTYALLQRDIDILAAQQWHIAVLDEAQAIKNARSKAALAAGNLRAAQTLALTGTPMENNLDELWSIMTFAVPGLLGDRTTFGRAFRIPIEKRGDNERRRVLASRLRPFLMRRSKENVASDLPEKSEIVVRIELDGAQRDLYETIRVAMHDRVRKELEHRGLARSRIVVLDALLKLRQVCCDPRLLSVSAARTVRGSAKLEALLEMLTELGAEGRRILLFSQFTSMLDLIKPELRDRHMPFTELRGETKDRTTPVRRFQEGEIPLFLISLKAGGTGLNLTAADTVIHYDPWWNPAVERQATDRAHRIGQSRPVFVYKLITTGTVEERILDLQQRKAELAAGLFDTSASLNLAAEEIDRLFAP
jgi:hypothetical protein